MLNLLIILFGKTFVKLSRSLNLGSGSTWPGHIALKLNKKFIQDILKNNKIKIILIAGTNGKTTTSKLIQEILIKNNVKVFQNNSGANLLNGIASSLIQEASLNKELKKEFAIFEIDENSLPLVLDDVIPDYLVILNLFRDQLDRYGEIDTIAKKWKESIGKLNKKTKLILNADDPLIAFLGHEDKLETKYFGLNEQSLSKIQHASDSVYCPNCGTKLSYDAIYFSHLGDWKCLNCKFSRPKITKFENLNYPLLGNYNKYNILAAALTVNCIGITLEKINKALVEFKPAFGRQEIIRYKNKNVQIFLSKNPTSFNESLKTAVANKGKYFLLVLNDRIPDGRDISWIWDFDLEEAKAKNVTVSGDRTYDMALRLEYAGIKNLTEPNLRQAINLAIENLPKDEILYILPTYSAMLEIRKIITGRKIL
ncbi:Mur ligase family protein [Patescibacteria group bacterium]|nr:Mur ligase family protein [Patescibacteria group bacterium]